MSPKWACPRHPCFQEVFHTLSRMVKLQVVLQSRQRGATAVEYALMASLIALVIIVAVKALGSQLVVLFNRGASSV